MVPALEHGKTYLWRVRAVDTAGEIPAAPVVGQAGPLSPQAALSLPGRGNPSDFSEILSFTVDTVAPTVPTALRRISAGNDPTPEFRWKRSEDDIAVDFYEVAISRIGPGDVIGRVEDEDCDDVTNLCTFTVAENLADDDYNIVVTAVDLATNENSTAPVDFFIDTEPPTKPGVPACAAGSTDLETPDGIRVLLTWERSTDGGSGVDFYRVVIDPGNITATAKDNVACFGDDCNFRMPPLIDGDYTFTVSAVDVATNESDSSSNPEPIFLGDPGKPRNLRQIEPRFVNDPAFKWKGPSKGDVKTYQVDITGPDFKIDFEDFLDPVFFSNVKCNDGTCPATIDRDDVIQLTVSGSGLPDGVPEGIHRIGVTVITEAGVQGKRAEITFTVDTIPPEPPTDLVVDATELVEGDDRTPVLTWTASPGDEVSGLDHYAITITGEKSGTTKSLRAAVEDCNVFTNLCTFTIPDEDALADDLYNAEVEAVDVAGNSSTPATDDFLVDLLPPTPPGNLRRTSSRDDRTPTFAWVASEDAGIGVDIYRVHIESVNLVDKPESTDGQGWTA